MSRRPAEPPLVSATDRFAAVVLQVENLARWVSTRNSQRREALPDEPLWEHYPVSNASIHSEAAELFPGRRGAWVR